MRKTTTDDLLDRLNGLRRLAYPQIGYVYFADIRGDGNNIKSVYQIINAGGGVSYAHELNGDSPRSRCNNIRAAIAGRGERKNRRRAKNR